jgi:hypothetical protein
VERFKGGRAFTKQSKKLKGDALDEGEDVEG